MIALDSAIANQNKIHRKAVADPGFPVGGRGPRKGGRGLPRWLRFKNFVCQNERIWTLGGGGRAPGICQCRSANEKVTHTSSRPDLIGKFVIGIATHHQAINLHRCTTS